MNETSRSEPPKFDRPEAQDLLRQMLRIRRLEERAADLYGQGKIRGFLHLYIGQEAIAVGVMDHLEPHDPVLATYREHGHALMKGLSADSIMAEMYGKQEGCSRGRGGSMHLFSRDHHFYGGNAIVGAHLPLAVGLALAEKMQGRRRVTVCFFGEGAVAEGEFHEAMNLAALWKVPVIFVCENNRYAMGTALDRCASQPDMHLKAASYNMTSLQVDGMDLLAVHAAARRAVRAVRGGEGPIFLEFRTYRFRAHSMFDAELYREKSEVEEWKKRCPIESFEAYLRQQDLLDDAEREAIEAQVTAEIDASVAFAEAGSWESVEDLTRFVYSEGHQREESP